MEISQERTNENLALCLQAERATRESKGNILVLLAALPLGRGRGAGLRREAPGAVPVSSGRKHEGFLLLKIEALRSAVLLFLSVPKAESLSVQRYLTQSTSVPNGLDVVLTCC